VNDVRLADPWFLALLAPLALVIAWRFLRRSRAVDGGSMAVLGDLPRTLRARTTWLPGLVAVLASVLVIGALARPLQGREEARITAEGVDIMLVLDTSSSMLKEGLESGFSNLDVVKEVVADFVRGREHDRMGLITFAAYARTVCPPTLDRDALLQHLASVQSVTPNGQEDGTAIGIALGQAARKLRESDASSRVVILLTDGENNVELVHPRDAALLCKELGVKVYTIGAGQVYVPSLTGWVKVDLETSLLEEIAATTSGRFYRARDTEALLDVYDEIDALERAELEDFRFTDFDDLYPWLLAPALGLLVLELLLRRGPYLEACA